MTITPRQAVAADLPALRDLFLQSRRGAFSWETSPSWSLDDLDRETEDELLLVAHAGERLAGFVSVWEPDDFIHHLHVHPKCLRGGIGRGLLRALPGWPARRYRLKCLRLNAPALAFYEACRFVEIGRGGTGDCEYLLLESNGDSPG